jgi:hypothetical protein
MSDSPRSPAVAAAHDEDVQEHASVEEQEEMHRQAVMEMAAMAPDLHKLLAKLARLQYPESWQISATEASSRSHAHHQEYRARLVDALPNVDADGNVLETDDEGDEQALEARSSDSEGDNGSDMEEFVAPEDEDDEADGEVQQRSWKSMMEHAARDDGEFGAGSSESDSDGNSSESGSDSGSESENEDVEEPVASAVAQMEPVDEELDGIDPALIVSGTRQRRPPTRFVPAGFDALMLADDAEDSEDDEESQDDDEEDEEEGSQDEDGEAQEQAPEDNGESQEAEDGEAQEQAPEDNGESQEDEEQQLQQAMHNQAMQAAGMMA